MSAVSLNERIHGSLLGAAAGAELGFARCVEPERFTAATPESMLEVELAPVRDYRPEPHRTNLASATALVDAGAQAYLCARGRATPETFGAVLRDHEGIAFPAFAWDSLHTVQELLKEGMNPRLSGFGTCPCGLISAAMPAVGIYHFAHPDYAYLDGVELASVAQGRLGADWAGLSAAAVAAAFAPAADSASVVDSVLRVAFENSRELFLSLDRLVGHARGLAGRGEFIAEWHRNGGVPTPPMPEHCWLAYNPVSLLLQVLAAHSAGAQQVMALLVTAPDYRSVVSVSAVLGGAVLGAMYGLAAFPDAWREWADPIVEPWLGLAGIVEDRLQAEKRIIRVTERLNTTGPGTDSLLKEKTRGCILAGAIGNAMGSPVEGRMYWEVDEQYPGGIDGILDPSRLETEDDNQMAALLMETYVARNGLPVMARHFGKTWHERLNRNRFYPYCMGHAYDKVVQGWDPRIIGHWAVVTGSTVMCMEPVGIYHLGDPAFAAIDALAVSYMYQRGLDAVVAAMLAATVAEALQPDATVDSVCRAAVEAAPAEPFTTFDKRPFESCRHYIEVCLEVAANHDDVLAARQDLYDRCLLYHLIDPLELWGLSLAMFRIADGDVRQAAIGGTNIGRDSDTIAGRAAMLAGTLRGAGNVPREWVDLFPPRALQRIDRNAASLTDLVTGPKLNILKRRQEVV